MSSRVSRDAEPPDDKPAGQKQTLPQPAEALLEQAVVRHRAGELAEAESLYKEVLKEFPRHPLALHLLGVLALQAGQNASAIDFFDRAIASYPNFAEAHCHRGNALYNLGRYQESLASYDRAVALNPSYAEALVNRGSVLHSLGQFEAALGSYDRAIAINPDHAMAWSNRGNPLQALNRYQEALESCERAVVLAPEFADAWINRGRALHALNQCAAALECYNRAIDLNPNRAEAYNNRGAAEHALGQYAAALESYKRAVALNPQYLEAWVNQGNVLHALGQFGAAVESYDRAIALNPSYVVAWSSRGNALYALDRYEDCLESYDRAIALFPALPDVWNNRSTVLLRLRSYRAALESAERAITLNPAQTEAHNNRGSALFALGQYQAAIQSYESAIGLQSDLFDAHFNRGYVVQHYQSALDTDEMASLLRVDFDSVMREVSRISAIPGASERRAAFDALPPEFQSHPVAADFRNINFIRNMSTGHDLVFYCAPIGEIWNPHTARTKGIGGSEEAVIWLSRLLKCRGWNVTVYAACGGVEREYDGVQWKPHWMWNYRDQQDVTVIWRRPETAYLPVHSGKVILDAHDAIEASEFTPQVLDRICKICVKSNFHRTLYPRISDDKFAIIPNGIDAKLFQGEGNRDPYLLVNTSSPDRSLEAYVDCFEQIKRRVPAARAQWAYGWNLWDAFPLLHRERTDWKSGMQARMREAGVDELGRLNHSAIIELYCRANVFAYPSEFAEIDCISLSKAMAAGAIPVTTDFGAMGDKAGHGGVFLHSQKTQENWVQPGQFHFEIADPGLRERFADEAVALLLNPPSEEAREPMRAWARSTFDWERIADQWHRLIC